MSPRLGTGIDEIDVHYHPIMYSIFSTVGLTDKRKLRTKSRCCTDYQFPKIMNDDGSGHGGGGGGDMVMVMLLLLMTMALMLVIW